MVGYFCRYPGGQLLLPPSRVRPEDMIEVRWDTRVHKIVSVLSEKALDVQDWRTDDGAPIQQWDYHGGTHQQWRLISGSQASTTFSHILLSFSEVSLHFLHGKT
jgi:hypothetical protein